MVKGEWARRVAVLQTAKEGSKSTLFMTILWSLFVSHTVHRKNDSRKRREKCIVVSRLILSHIASLPGFTPQLFSHGLNTFFYSVREKNGEWSLGIRLLQHVITR